MALVLVISLYLNIFQNHVSLKHIKHLLILFCNLLLQKWDVLTSKNQ